MSEVLAVGARYLRHKTTGTVYAYDETLSTHPDVVEFTHTAKEKPKARAPAKATPAPVAEDPVIPTTTAADPAGLPETDPALLEELGDLHELSDDEE